MIPLSPIQFLLLAELLLLFGIAATALGLMFVFQKRKERRAVNRLIARIKEDEKRRRDETRTLMQEKFGFQDEALEAMVNQVAREEKRLYQTLINLFLSRDLNVLEVLHVNCEGVTEPYRTIDFTRVVPGGEGGGDDVQSDLSVELDMLREENERLTTELGVTMDTMGKMLQEYASMYGGGVSGELDKAKMIETFRQEDAPEAGVELPAGEAVGIEAQATAQPSGQEPPVEQSGSDAHFPGLADDAEELDIGIELDDETVVLDEAEVATVKEDETLVINIDDDDEFVELEEIDDETELIDLADDDLEKTR